MRGGHQTRSRLLSHTKPLQQSAPLFSSSPVPPSKPAPRWTSTSTSNAKEPSIIVRKLKVTREHGRAEITDWIQLPLALPPRKITGPRSDSLSSKLAGTLSFLDTPTQITKIRKGLRRTPLAQPVPKSRSDDEYTWKVINFAKTEPEGKEKKNQKDIPKTIVRSGGGASGGGGGGGGRGRGRGRGGSSGSGLRSSGDKGKKGYKLLEAATMNRNLYRPLAGLPQYTSGLSELPKSILNNLLRATALKRSLAQDRKISQSQILEAPNRRRLGPEMAGMKSAWRPVAEDRKKKTKDTTHSSAPSSTNQKSPSSGTRDHTPPSSFQELFGSGPNSEDALKSRERILRSARELRLQRAKQVTRQVAARNKSKLQQQARAHRLLKSPHLDPSSEPATTSSMFSRLFEDAKSYLPDPESSPMAEDDMLVDVSTREFASFSHVPDVGGGEIGQYWVLNGSPHNLVASDFQRLVMGRHIRAWSRRLKIYQAYNPATYAPLQQYVLRFRDSAEALGFRTAFEAPDTRKNPEVFTLAPPNSGRALSLRRIEAGAAGENGGGSEGGRRTPAFDLAGAVKKRLHGAPCAVHVRLEHGEARVWEVRKFIQRDGEARGNLEWGLHRPYSVVWRSEGGEGGGDGEGAGGKGKQKPRGMLVRRPGVIALAPRRDLEAYNDAEWMEDAADMFADDQGRGRGKGKGKDAAGWGGWQRDFAIGFADHEEARRFVRRWHRRLVSFGGGGSGGGDVEGGSTVGKEVLMNVRLLNGGFEGNY
ncbi:hypothetical protein MKZ38_004991 [Zalerion maritima]|uniref:Uncharacterized protein n=1 Tax=Zalerion maritima TaxID=339359 RepID=A0AAD5RLW0_9PEZI|nr:hypothetical protein MKZ38_004991 [Zalerion maritima]